MSAELDILKIVAGNPHISQRKIAEETGISLGQVNFLIKKFVKKGLIKIEGQSPKSLRYNLTPRGLAEKAERTLKYMKISYAAVIALTDKIRALAKESMAEGYNIYVYGSQDEMLEIIKLALQDFKWKYFVIIKEAGQIKQITAPVSTAVVFCWETDKLAEIAEIENCKAINILV